MRRQAAGNLSSLAIAAAASAMFCGSVPAASQTAAVPNAVAPQPTATRVLAIGSLTKKATPADLPTVLEREVPATLKLYLAGKISDWYAKTDQTGVVFVLNVTTVAEAQALLDPLPLGQAGMMVFQYTPIGPLRPLGLLLKQPTR